MPHASDWRILAQQASVETDSTKLIVLVAELNRVLLQNEETKRQKGFPDRRRTAFAPFLPNGIVRHDS